MRVYLPSTLPLLAGLLRDGAIGAPPVTVLALTPGLREWYLDDDAEELEHAAFTLAARASLRLLDIDPAAPRQRVVVSADVPDATVEILDHLDRGAARVSAAIALDQVAAVHVDDLAAAPVVAAAVAAVLEADLGDSDAAFAVDTAEAEELLWYGVQELPDLLAD